MKVSLHLTFFLKNNIKKLREMAKKIFNDFNDLTIYDKLKKLESNLKKLNLLIESIENEKMGEMETANFVRRFIDLKKLKRIGSQINHFLRFPLLEHKPGRPMEYPESDQEKKRYKSYRLEGYSIRNIAKKEKISPDTVFRKLKKYRIK